VNARNRKIKGSRVEREIVNALKDAGIDAFRVPLSGAGAIYGDVKFGPGHKYTGEVKARKNGAGFATLERWMGDCDALILKKNHATPMVCLSWEFFVQLMKYEQEAEGGLD
jgi:hypothetical protein